MSEQNYANVQQQAELMKYISDNMKIPVLGAGGGFAPIGMYGWSPDYVTGAPQGWLRCEGQEVNIVDYPELATFYASQHGASNYWGGDGITTFAVPDLRGEFIRGAGTNSHANQGNGGAVGEHQDGTIVNASFNSSMINYSLPSGYTMNYDWFIENGRRNTITPTTVDDSEGRLGTTRPTNTSGVFFVKATLSDAEINAFNVYTPREHQVAWWEEEIDGVWKRKPVYEKTWKYNKTSGETVIFDCNDYDIEHIFVTDTHTMNSNIFNGTGTYYQSESDKSRFFRKPDNKMVAQTGTTYMNGTSYATFRYTKSTDDWQTS